MIVPIYIPDVARLVQSTTHEERQPPSKKRPPRRRDDTPAKKVYTPEGVLEEAESPLIDLIG